PLTTRQSAWFAIKEVGQRQRAALARAIVRQPHAFLMDEPLSNLDAKLRQHMRVQIKHIQRELKITTVYVTHDQIEAMTLADRIVVMQSGAIQQIGTPDEIYNNPANTFVAGFIGAPPMNLVDGAVEDGFFKAPGLNVPLQTSHSGTGITLGFRPEDCLVEDGSSQLQGEVYGVEPTGDVTYLTLKAGKEMIEVKAHRDYRAELGTGAQVSLDQSRLCFFDSKTGARLR
ncbi:MAG: ABC transporter ATP-binding protein, partial [Pseudomonadota bacterium]